MWVVTAVDTWQITLLGLLDLSAAFDHHLLQWLKFTVSFSLTIHSRSHMTANCRRSEHCCLMSHEAPYLDHCCTSCILQSSTKWPHDMTCIRFTSASLSVTLPLPSTDSQHASETSTPGCEWADPTKMQVIWLGSGQLFRQVSTCDVSVVSSWVKPVKSASDLGM